jgi:hypothetical protein
MTKQQLLRKQVAWLTRSRANWRRCALRQARLISRYSQLVDYCARCQQVKGKRNG